MDELKKEMGNNQKKKKKKILLPVELEVLHKKRWLSRVFLSLEKRKRMSSQRKFKKWQ